MNKIVFFLILLGLVTKSQICFGQTHYTGIANILYTRTCDNGCSYSANDSSIGSIEYSIYPRKGVSDSASYIITVTHPMNTLRYSGIPTNGFYLKKDADSIVFFFGFHSSHSERGQVPINDPCRNYNVYEDYTGIARISTITAGIATKENGVLNPQIFPNPTTGFLKIKANASNAIVADCLGRVVISQKIEAHDNVGLSTLNVSSLPSGCYTLLLDEGMNKVTTKFIKY